MATLLSPGVSISVIDQSMNVGAGPGTVPLIFITTQQNKADPTGQNAIAPGTTLAQAGAVYTITSQRDLIATFGDPNFYSVGGTSINGYPLNEYGLLAAYSYLSIANQCIIVRAAIDLAQLETTPIAPTSPVPANTYWLDESATGSAYGLFIQQAGVWVAVTPTFVYNFASGVTGAPTPTDGVNGSYATVFYTSSGTLTYWTKTGGVWVQIGTTTGTAVVIQQVWPNLPATTAPYWIKTTSPASGANIVLRKMSATLGAFTQVESPLLPNDASADTYYSTDKFGSTGQVYIEPVAVNVAAGTTVNSIQFRISTGASASWNVMNTIIGSTTVPSAGPVAGQLWFNGLVGLNSQGQSTVDILVADGISSWQNINLPGFSNLPVTSGRPTLYLQSQDPQDNTPIPTLNVGDIWVQTDASPYPVINRWAGTSWTSVSNTDQTTPNGIIFQDARPNPMYNPNNQSNSLPVPAYTGQHNGGTTNPDLDPDAPDAALYPAGFLLWNTRYSTNNVKTWTPAFSFDNVAASADNTNRGSFGRWVTASGNDAEGNPYMGAAAQQIMAVKSVKAEIDTNEAILAEDLFFNLIAAPGYVEVTGDLLTLNDTRGDTAFVVGDSPFTLNSNATSLQAWATNAAGALTDGPNGLVSASKYLGTYYPSGLSSNTDGTDVVVPPSHMALNVIAYNDQVAYPWMAPAGLQRGVVNNASSVGYVSSTGQFVPTKLSQGQRDVLYTNTLNPIRTMPSGDIVVYGQITRQNYSSATSRINVVRLENYIRYQLNIISQPFLFQPNDTITQNAITAAINSFLSELVTLRGLYDFLVVCDSSNNTPARVDANQLWADIAIQPVEAVEFIYIPIRIVNTGASLTAAISSS